MGGSEILAQSLAGCLLCLAPAVLTLAWLQRALGGKPEELLLAAIGGMVLRMVVVFSGGLALFLSVDVLHSAAFWMWVLGFYLLTLILEIALALIASRRQGGPLRRPNEEACQPPLG
jgi:biotin transporter BioY